jgi:two-component sensor histidine kinase
VLDVPMVKILRLCPSADNLLLVSGVGWEAGLVGRATVGVDDDSQAGFTLQEDRAVAVRDLLSETRFSGPPLLHQHGVRSGLSVPIPGTDDRAFGVLGVHSREVRTFDEADTGFVLSVATIVANAARHHASAEHRQLLIREMAHRAGNMLQLVSSIAAQTFSDESRIAVARKAFTERLGSLARANYLIAQGGWTSTRFAELARQALAPFADRVVMAGRDILLPPELCFDLGLVLHELATNSVKHGTLGRPEGQVRLQWSVTSGPQGSGTFRMQWIDPLPSPSVTPSSGFGSRLVHALVERKWNGRTEVEREPSYRFSVELPLPDGEPAKAAM